MDHAAVYILYHLLPFYKQEFVNSDSTIYGEVAGHHIILLGKMCCLNLFGEYSFVLGLVMESALQKFPRKTCIVVLL